MIADRLDPRISRPDRAEPRPRLVAEHIGQAVPAGQGEDQRLVGQIVGRDLRRGLVEVLGRVRHLDLRVVAEHRRARRQDDPRTRVAVQVRVAAQPHRRTRSPALRADAQLRGLPGLHLEDRRRQRLCRIRELAPDRQPARPHPGDDATRTRPPPRRHDTRDNVQVKIIVDSVAGTCGRSGRVDHRGIGVDSALPQASHRWQPANLAHGELLPIRKRINWARMMREDTVPIEVAAQPQSEVRKMCSCCPHPWTAHDATAQRYCGATLAAALSRKCICRHG